jgi:hypothetical protein
MSDNASVRAKVSQYLLLKKEIADLKAMQERVKEELEPYLQEADTNARGSHVIGFETPLEIHGVQYKELQKVRKRSKLLNEERALELLDDKAVEWSCAQPDAGISVFHAPYRRAIITIEHIDHDALWDLFAQDLLSDEEYDSLFDVTETWAFSPTKV